MKIRITVFSGCYYNLVLLQVAFLVIVFSSLPNPLNAQALHDFSFKRDTATTCLNTDGALLSSGFAGGMNSCQYGAIDLNGDLVKDLVVFDRHGNRILPFITKSDGLQGFIYSPGYAKYFPQMENWMQLIDYNNDGKEDIFTYTTGGIKVFRNNGSGVPHFVQVSHPYLRSLQGPSFTNILVTYADYPAISDIDSDGDLDILTFWGLGSFVEMHKNMSVEKYGNSDSLDFIRTETCWGRFAEGEDSDQIMLDTCKGVSSADLQQSNPLTDGDPKHTGSTILAVDLDGDNDKDLLLGDVDYQALKALWNGGDMENALITSVNQTFPAGYQPVDLVSFPVPCLVDVNNDGKDDLLVSPFDPSLTRGESKESSWLYLNSGTVASPVFNLTSKNYLQGDMLDFGSGAYPLATDIDGDGLTDLLVGNYGYLDSSYYETGHILKCIYKSRLAYIRNIGTDTVPSFQLINDDFANLSHLKILAAYPALTDLDGDNDVDLLLGNADGSFIFFENLAGPGSFPLCADPVFHYQSLDAGDFSTPQFIDLDQDGLLDLVSGRRDGKLSYYHNTGSITNPIFTLVTDHLGNVDVTDPELSYFGFSTPCFFKGSDSKWRLFIGSESNGVSYYNDISGNLGGTFSREEAPIQNTHEGLRTGVAVMNADGDAFADMVIGNYAGGLAFYTGITPQPIGIMESFPSSLFHVSLFPNPASEKLHITIDQSINSRRVKIEIFRIDGSVCYTSVYSSFAKEVTIPVSEFTGGIYICKISIKSENGEIIQIAHRRLIIAR
jgi:hypothetical protein